MHINDVSRFFLILPRTEMYLSIRKIWKKDAVAPVLAVASHAERDIAVSTSRHVLNKMLWHTLW